MGDQRFILGYKRPIVLGDSGVASLLNGFGNGNSQAVSGFGV